MGEDGSPGVRVDVLGPLRLTVDAVPVDVPGAKRRAVLALLALAEGRTVTIDALVDALWPSASSPSESWSSDGRGPGRQALHAHVSRLRNHLGPAAARLQTAADGYRLELRRDELDLSEAKGLLARGRAVARSDRVGSVALLRRARDLWRGPILADLADLTQIATAIEDCARLHREVTDSLIAAAIAAGQAGEVVDLAAAALAADPLREPAVLLSMRACAATGHAAEALRVGREYRRRLAHETGLDPTPALGATEREIAGGAAGPTPVRAELSGSPATRLVGREAQVAALHRLLASERLVTLVGPGGVGKTRVALEVARRGQDATILLLAPLTDPGAVPHALAAALGVNVVQGDVLTACAAVLGDRPGLLVIDNCEHLLDAARDLVALLLASCPALVVLATSREPLSLGAEYTSRLAPLAVPSATAAGAEAGAELAHVPSVALFLDRARRVRPGLEDTPDELGVVAEIVRRLDGIPLAIELAAGRLTTFSPTDLRDRLDRSLDLLGGGRPAAEARHRTLRTTVEWSYDLLEAEEQKVFRHLAGFADGLDLDDAERLAADLGVGADPGPVLARLVDASMIEVDFAGGTRYRLLATIRSFGLDRLAVAGEDEVAVDYLMHWAVGLVRRIASELTTEREPAADLRLRREVANLRAAWRLARDRERVDHAAAMVTALIDAIAYRDLVELRGWAEELAEALEANPASSTDEVAAAVMGTAAEAAYHRGDLGRAEAFARSGLAKATGDPGRLSCLLPLAVICLARGAYPEAIECALEAAPLRPGPGESFGIAALAAAYSGDPAQARAWNDRGVAQAVSPTLRAWGAYVEGEIESLAGRSGEAESCYLRALDLARGSGATFLVGVAHVGFLVVLGRTGRLREALVGYREVIDYFARTGNWTHLWAALRNLADLLQQIGDGETAALLHVAADQAPDAPADDRTRVVPGAAHVVFAVTRDQRADVLDLTRRAIDRALHGIGET